MPSRFKEPCSAVKLAKKDYPYPLLAKIGKACQNTTDAAVNTSASRNRQSLAKAPGTPVCDAWETHSGPVLSGPMNYHPSPLGTPARKVVLKVKNPTAAPPKRIRLSTPIDPRMVPMVPLAPDIEQRLARFQNEYAADADDALLVKQLEGLEREFVQDSVAAKEFLLNDGAAILTTGRMGLRMAVLNLAVAYLSGLPEIGCAGSLVSLVFAYLSENVGSFAVSPYAGQMARRMASLIGRVHVDEAVVMKLAAQLQSALYISKANGSLAAVMACLATSYVDVRDMFLAEMLAAKAEESEPVESYLLASIVQAELIRTRTLTEARIKLALAPFTEDLYRLLTANGSGGALVLGRLLKGTVPLVKLGGLPTGVVVARHLAQFAMMLLTSGDRVKLDTNAKCVLLDGLIGLGAQVLDPGREGDAVHNEQVAGLLRELGANVLATVTSSVIVLLVRVATESSPQLRIKALRGLVSVLETNGEFVGRPGFIDFVVGKLTDPAVMVRDVALELLSKCLDTSKLVEMNLLDKIAPRLDDSSTSVRKRVLRLYRDILVKKAGDSSVQALVVSGLLTTVTDEDAGMAALAHKTLKEGWLAPTLVRAQDRQETVQFVASIVHIIRVLGAKAECIQAFLKRCNEEAALKEPVNALCTGVVDVLFESLIGSIEQTNTDAVRFILSAITVFVGQEHSYLENHLRLLYELTKATQMNTIELALKLMTIAVKSASRASLLQLSGCQQHLKLLILKGSEPVVRNAIDFCFEYLRVTEDSSGLVLGLWDRFAGFLGASRAGPVSPTLLSPVCRALFSLGCLVRGIIRTETGDGTHMAKALELFVGLFNSGGNPTVAFYALQAIGFIFIEAPRVAMAPSVTGVIRLAFETDSSRLVATVLRAFIEMVEREKPDSSSVSFDKSMKPTDTNVCANIIQAYVEQIVATANSKTKECQMLSLRLLSFILFSGLCHPHQVIPSIVALSTSRDKDLASKAGEIFNSLAETHQSFVFSNYTSVLATIYALHTGYDEPVGYAELDFGYEAHVGRLYAQLRTKKGKRADLTAVLFQELEEAGSAYARFVAENIAMLPVRTMEECASVFQRVNDMTLTAASAFLEDANVGSDRVLLLLALRGFLATTYGLTCERCEKAVNQDSFGKTAVLVQLNAPFPPHAKDPPLPVEERQNEVRALLEEQRWIEQGVSERPPKKPAARGRPKKRRRRISHSSSEDDDDDPYGVY